MHFGGITLSAWPIIGKGKNQLAWKNAKLAVAVYEKNRNCHLATPMRRHFNVTAAKCGWGENAEGIICELLSKVEALSRPSQSNCHSVSRKKWPPRSSKACTTRPGGWRSSLRFSLPFEDADEFLDDLQGWLTYCPRDWKSNCLPSAANREMLLTKNFMTTFQLCWENAERNFPLGPSVISKQIAPSQPCWQD